MIDLDPRWDINKRQDEKALLDVLSQKTRLTKDKRERVVRKATLLVQKIRKDAKPSLMDVFLEEYGLSTDEGVALMCLAEALLRVPDSITIDALIEDKIAPSDWSQHIGHSLSPLVNASTWGLLLTGKVLDDSHAGIIGTLKKMIRRLGEPMIRVGVAGAMRKMGQQFVLGQNIADAMERARASEAEGYSYSYDMLGEAAMTADDAARYARSYSEAIKVIATACSSDDFIANPGISVKLSALHPRYEVSQTKRVMTELVPVLLKLAKQAARAGMSFNIDAEEADRLSLSLKVIETVLLDPELAGWAGFGVVVQAYGRRAGDVINGLYEMAISLDRRIIVRLVKGAYWDSEIKHAQVEGLADFPVFTRKAASDVSYLVHAQTLLDMVDRIYPQFATHNAHSVMAILELAKGVAREDFEFQRLHGMGEALHGFVKAEYGTRCRIYAPVGAHRDLLAYLVRRLLENGANSSFVNQIVDKTVKPSIVAACPFEAFARAPGIFEPQLKTSPMLFLPERKNSQGFDLSNICDLTRIDKARRKPEPFEVKPILADAPKGEGIRDAYNPATGKKIGRIMLASAQDVKTAFASARIWDVPAQKRAAVLNRAADLYEAEFGHFFALLATEAGKTLADGVAELREAVDFLRYYASGAKNLKHKARGIFCCISPWNFPLAIFTGQVSAALAAGNAVLCKPADTTPAIAAYAVRLLHKAGVPREVLQFLPGSGRIVGSALTAHPRVNGVAFTGSIETAHHIQNVLAENAAPGTPLIAETGGINAMIVDSTALAEQAIGDIIASAFQSAGQRCSALRCLYLQQDIAPLFCEMLKGAMNELKLGNPWDIATDVGPVINEKARAEINAYVEKAMQDGRLLHRLCVPEKGVFVAPSLIKVDGIGDLKREVFGPVLHIATFKAEDFDQIIADVNATGYGLTFGLHTRINDRIQKVADKVHAGNIYVNRNQIGAIVGSQPFGGEGLSGTGPKAGGMLYLQRFTCKNARHVSAKQSKLHDIETIKRALSKANSSISSCVSEKTILPGPTGELNSLSMVPRLVLLCLGPGKEALKAQSVAVQSLGGCALEVMEEITPEILLNLSSIGGVLWWGDEVRARSYARALAKRNGQIIPLITTYPDKAHILLERHLCVDTTAAGGNASLLAGKQ